MRIRILSGHLARGAREAVAVVSDPCLGSYTANDGYSWAETAPALASISPPDSGLYRRNARGRQSGIRQMLCLLECSIVCGSSGNLPLMKILVVDDQALIREALHGLLRSPRAVRDKLRTQNGPHARRPAERTRDNPTV